MRFRNLKPIGNGSCRQIDGGVVVGMGLMAALPTFERRLRSSVAFIAVSASGTGPTGIARVNSYDGNTEQLALVGDKGTELIERPAIHLRSLSLAKPCPVADALEVLKSDAASGVFSQSNDAFADDVVNVFPEIGFFSTNSLHGAASILASSPLMGTVHLAPKAAMDSMVLNADGFNVVPCESLPITGCGKVAYAQVNADEISNGNRGLVGNINGDKKEPFPVFSENQVALALGKPKAICLIFTHQERNYDPTFQRRYADTINALKPNILTHRKRDGGVLSKARSLGFVGLECLACPRDTPNRGVGGKSKPLAQFPVNQFLQRKLIRKLSFECNASYPRSRRIKSFHRLPKHHGLVLVGEQLDLQGECDTRIVLADSPNARKNRIGDVKLIGRLKQQRHLSQS